MRKEKIHEVTVTLTPGIMVGQVCAIGGSPFIVVGIRNTLGEFGVTTLQVVDPPWTWKLKYHLKNFFRRVWQIIKRPFRRLGSRAGRG